MPKKYYCLLIILLFPIMLLAQKEVANISPNLAKQLSQTTTHQILIYYNDEKKVTAYCDSASIKTTLVNKQYNCLSTVLNTQQVIALSKQPFISFMAKKELATTEILTIGYEKRMHSISKHLHNNNTINAKGIIIGIKEKNYDVADVDIQKRMVNSPLVDNSIDVHATTIATLIGGAGNSFHTGKGIANAARFFSSSFTNLFPDNSATLATANVTVQNHSYGTGIQNYYGPEAQAYDQQLNSNPQLIHIFSSGNAGLLTSPTGQYSGISGFANLTGNFKMAKNVLTIGAVDTSGQLMSFSSAGPTYDGRVAPQLVALGANGTSDAAALVTGTVALLQQVYKDSNVAQLPNAALLKAILYTTANKNALPVLSYKTGYGRLDVVKAIKVLQDKTYKTGSVATNEVWTTTIPITTNIKKLTVTLNYTDTVANVNTAKALVNNLDVAVTHNSTIYNPWVLSTNANKDSLQKMPIRNVDSLNTTEQITIDNPAIGNYIVSVKGSAVQTMQKQSFAVAYTLDTANTFQFTNPITADDINVQENPILKIEWITALADTNAVGSLFVDYDATGTWVLLDNNVLLKKQFFHWVLPSTNKLLQFKMITPFGTYYSNKVLAHIPTKWNLLYNCTDSAKLLWPQVTGATAYHIFALTDSAYLKQIATVTNTAYLLNKQAMPYRQLAVQPQLTDVWVTRSALGNIDAQGVQCFYRQLVVQYSNGNNLLTFDLSYPSLVRKIVFEKLNDNGTIIALDSVIISTTNTTYTANDYQLKSGENKYRGKIILNNGAIIYTNVVSNIVTGKNLIILYPTAVAQNSVINYLQKDFNTEARLLIYASNGQLIKRVSLGLNGGINTFGFQKGIYIYHYISVGKLTQTGKFFIY